MLSVRARHSPLYASLGLGTLPHLVPVRERYLTGILETARIRRPAETERGQRKDTCTRWRQKRGNFEMSQHQIPLHLSTDVAVQHERQTNTRSFPHVPVRDSRSRAGALATHLVETRGRLYTRRDFQACLATPVLAV